MIDGVSVCMRRAVKTAEDSQWTESPGADIEMPKASKESDMGKGCPIPTEGEVSGGGMPRIKKIFLK